jgi:hypothetical protein
VGTLRAQGAPPPPRGHQAVLHRRGDGAPRPRRFSRGRGTLPRGARRVCGTPPLPQWWGAPVACIPAARAGRAGALTAALTAGRRAPGDGGGRGGLWAADADGGGGDLGPRRAWRAWDRPHPARVLQLSRARLIGRLRCLHATPLGAPCAPIARASHCCPPRASIARERVGESIVGRFLRSYRDLGCTKGCPLSHDLSVSYYCVGGCMVG